MKVTGRAGLPKGYLRLELRTRGKGAGTRREETEKAIWSVPAAVTKGARFRRPTLLAKERAWTPAPRHLWEPVSRGFPLPTPPALRQGGPRRPGAPSAPGEAERRRTRRHSPHGHAAPASGRPHDECVPGGRQPALGRAGSRERGPQLQRAPQRAQRRAGQLRLQQEDAADRQRQEARVRRAAPQRHGDESRDRRLPAPLPVRASSGLGARRRRYARHVTAARHGLPERAGLRA